jgi:hypothetical protein
MDFFRRFFLSFYSAAYYRQLRHTEQGYGLRYTLLLMLLMIALAVAITFGRSVVEPIHGGSWNYYRPVFEFYLHSLPQVALVAAVSIVWRLVMLFALSVAARLITLKLKPRMGYDAALRMAAAAYTPVALMDAAAFGWQNLMLPPYTLFACGLAMLLAALTVTR